MKDWPALERKAAAIWQFRQARMLSPILDAQTIKTWRNILQPYPTQIFAFSLNARPKKEKDQGW
jgi:hypothetical protein